MDLHETQRLLHGALAGRPEDRDRLFERFYRRTLLWCAGQMSQSLRARLEPEDAAQDIVYAAFKDFDSFAGGTVPEFGGWYWTIAANRLRDLAAYHGAQKRQPTEILPLTQTTPSQVAARSELAVKVRRAVETLSEDHRMAVCLVFLEERTPEEVGQIMGRSANAVRILYCRAMKELRRKMSEGA